MMAADAPCIAGDHFPNDDGTACAYCGLPAETVAPDELGRELWAAHTAIAHELAERNAAAWTATLRLARDDRAGRVIRWLLTSRPDDYTEPRLLAEARSAEPPEERRAGWRRGAIHDAADQIAEWYAEAIEAPDAGPLADIVGYALACVDWHDIASDIADALELPDPDPAADEDDDA